MASCHAVVQDLKNHADFTIALAGNPNVGKSSLFNQLTGLGVVTANYPGKTMELNLGSTQRGGYRIAIVDLPGTYALGAISQDQWVARQGVLDGRPDVVIVMLDATNLQRNLYLVLQFLDLELPVVVALNLVDQAEGQGIRIDSPRLAQLLGVPVVETVASRGEGVDLLIDTAIAYHQKQLNTDSGSCKDCSACALRNCPAATPTACGHRAPAPAYDEKVSGPRERLADGIRHAMPVRPHDLSARALAMLLLEQDDEFTALTRALPGGEKVLTLAQDVAVTQEGDEHSPAGQLVSTSLPIAQYRHALAAQIAIQVQTEGQRADSLATVLWRWSVRPATGLPMLGAALAAIFAVLYYGGNAVSALFAAAWGLLVSPAISALVGLVAGDGVVGRTLLWGLDAGIQAALSVGVSYVFVFYLMLAVLEDSGYFNSVAFLTDSIMHRFGLHGRASIPLLAAAGCNVPAIIGTRVLTTMRERVIASTLIVLIPCGARTAVIMGVVGQYAGIGPAVALFAIVLLLIVVVGVALNAILSGKSAGLVMEMFPFRAPDPLTVLKKTWFRLKDFVVVAMPIVLLGSFGLGLLYETGWVWAFVQPLAPIMEGLLGLPAVAGLTLIFAVLRKELALQLLVTLAIVQYGPAAGNLAHFMSGNQLFVYALVNTIYIPCVATIAVLGRELGWRRAAGISTLTIVMALAAGGLAHLTLGNA
jgi:ferrous iron transport protein B